MLKCVCGVRRGHRCETEWTGKRRGERGGEWGDSCSDGSVARIQALKHVQTGRREVWR
jgi:hypothetical protein